MAVLSTSSGRATRDISPAWRTASSNGWGASSCAVSLQTKGAPVLITRLTMPELSLPCSAMALRSALVVLSSTPLQAIGATSGFPGALAETIAVA